MEQSFSESLWTEAGPIWAAIQRHPFLVELRQGALPLDTFRYYVTQDYHYLEAFARAELSALLGTELERRLRLVACSDWQRNRFIAGSYSYARPGQHGARAQLAARVDGPLAFAGEACSSTDFATVHGAWQGGIDAVAQLMGDVR